MENAQTEEVDMIRELMLDGNAVAGVLQEIFSVEMTTSPTECTNCGCKGELGTLLAFTQAPGIVLRYKHPTLSTWMPGERPICASNGACLNFEADYPFGPALCLRSCKSDYVLGA